MPVERLENDSSGDGSLIAAPSTTGAAVFDSNGTSSLAATPERAGTAETPGDGSTGTAATSTPIAIGEAELARSATPASLPSTPGVGTSGPTKSTSGLFGSRTAGTASKQRIVKKYIDDPFRFSDGGVDFRAKLIGVQDVPESRGDQMCQESMQAAKAIVKASAKHKPRILLNISLDGVKIKDDKTQDVLHSFPVHRISFIARDVTDNRAFGLIYDTPENQHKFFAIKTAQTADNCVLTIRDMFNVVYEMKKEKINALKSPADGSPGEEAAVENKPAENGSAEEGCTVANLLDLETEAESIRQNMLHNDQQWVSFENDWMTQSTGSSATQPTMSSSGFTSSNANLSDTASTADFLSSGDFTNSGNFRATTTANATATASNAALLGTLTPPVAAQATNLFGGQPTSANNIIFYQAPATPATDHTRDPFGLTPFSAAPSSAPFGEAPPPLATSFAVGGPSTTVSPPSTGSSQFGNTTPYSAAIAAHGGGATMFDMSAANASAIDPFDTSHVAQLALAGGNRQSTPQQQAGGQVLSVGQQPSSIRADDFSSATGGGSGSAFFSPQENALNNAMLDPSASSLMSPPAFDNSALLQPSRPAPQPGAPPPAADQPRQSFGEVRPPPATLDDAFNVLCNVDGLFGGGASTVRNVGLPPGSQPPSARKPDPFEGMRNPPKRTINSMRGGEQMGGGAILAATTPTAASGANLDLASLYAAAAPVTTAATMFGGPPPPVPSMAPNNPFATPVMFGGQMAPPPLQQQTWAMSPPVAAYQQQAFGGVPTATRPMQNFAAAPQAAPMPAVGATSDPFNDDFFK